MAEYLCPESLSIFPAQIITLGGPSYIVEIDMKNGFTCVLKKEKNIKQV